MPEKINFQEMLSYMRPAGSEHQKRFCNRYLWPVFGKPDAFGNYVKIVGNSDIAFMAHHDTVHSQSGRSRVILDKQGIYRVTNVNCLGADCTTGVYIILKMIEAGVPGIYVIHDKEEIGCVGSRALVRSDPKWLDDVKFAISFDRKGYNSVITHQLGQRTCSDEFAKSFADAVDLPFVADDTGVYTDSNEYADVVPECTNISVGYFAQHTKFETQDGVFLNLLVNKLINADWSKLVCVRDPSIVEQDNWWQTYQDSYRQSNKSIGRELTDIVETNKVRALCDIIKENPLAIANMLHDLGYNAYDLLDEVQDYQSEIKPGRGFDKNSEFDYEF